ncbi:MAG: serine/threonine-protein kinase [Pseudomonadota bacterium]
MAAATDSAAAAATARAAPVARFMREAELTARLSHPHIVTVYAVGMHEGRPYLALEYLEGQNLRQRMDEERPGVRESLRIVLAIAQALAEAHRHRVLHRDLKPDNVILAKDGRLRLVDLGLAKMAAAETVSQTTVGESEVAAETVARREVAYREEGGGDQEDGVTEEIVGESEVAFCGATVAGKVRGTPAYMAPEQWRGEECGEATDIWALGVILYELLAGRRPYLARKAGILGLAVVQPEPVPPLATSQDIPLDLAMLAGRCLEKEAARRPSAAQVVDELDRLLWEGRRHVLAEQSPFRGLFPFAERHADFFFGRDNEIAGSSIRAANLAPAEGLRDTAGDQDAWTLLVASCDEGGLAKQLCARPELLGVLLHDLAARQRCKVLLFVDQLEEVLTMVADPTAREAFIRAICGVADHPSSPVPVRSGAPKPTHNFKGAPSCAVTRLAAGPAGTLVGGYANGTVILWTIADGAALESAKLHGPIWHLLYTSDRLIAATEVGQYLVWDLRAFHEEYCDLMRKVWRSIPVVWESGLPVSRRSLPDHRCATKGGFQRR